MLFDFIHEFLQVAAASAGVTETSGADVCVDVLQGLAQVLERWPVKLEGEHLILGSEWAAWEGDLRSLGFDRPEVLGRLQSAQVQISSHVASTTEESKSTLRGACHKAAELFPKLASLLHESESNFKEDMKTLAFSLVKTQTTIRNEYAACSTFSDNNLGVALGKELAELLQLSEHVMGVIQYFVGVYTALLFYRSPDTWAPRVEVAKKGKESLVKALSSLNDNKYASAFEGMCAHTVVKQMRRDAQTPAREGLHQVEGGPLARWAASGCGRSEGGGASGCSAATLAVKEEESADAGGKGDPLALAVKAEESADAEAPASVAGAEGLPAAGAVAASPSAAAREAESADAGAQGDPAASGQVGASSATKRRAAAGAEVLPGAGAARLGHSHCFTKGGQCDADKEKAMQTQASLVLATLSSSEECDDGDLEPATAMKKPAARRGGRARGARGSGVDQGNTLKRLWG